MKDVFRAFALTMPFGVLIVANSYLENRITQRLLVEAERRNTALHVRSQDDRATIHKMQGDILGRLAALERKVDALHPLRTSAP